MSSSRESAICEPIDSRRLIEFLYKDEMRLVEPHLLGYDADGDLTLSAWQLEGGSGEGWRDFHVDKLSRLRIADITFEGPRPGYNPNDETIDRIVCRL